MKSVFETIDLEGFYKLQRTISGRSKRDSAAWDDKSEDMDKKSSRGIYNQFLKSKISLIGVESILDVGCGTGVFSVDFAPLVKNVYAFDFSPKMLAILQEKIKRQNITNIKCFLNDIEGDWTDVPVCDIVVASRSLEVDNLKKALENLNAHAKKAVYLTLKVGRSFLSEEFLSILGREIQSRADYIYAVNMLYQMGINAKVDFAPKEDEACCVLPKSADEYVKSISWSLDGITKKEEKTAREHFKKCQEKGIAPAFRNNAWALIYWEKRES